MKKVIAFDLDGTLAPSKSPIPDRVGECLSALLDKFQVCVISGGKFEQFEKQLLSNLQVSPAQLERLHIMPTCGTRYHVFDLAEEKWKQVYAEDFAAAQKRKIIDALNKGIDALGYREKKVYGECLEDRGSQITYSIFSQDIVDVLGEKGVHI